MTSLGAAHPRDGFTPGARALVVATLAGLTLFALTPLAWLLSTSLKEHSDVFRVPPELIPSPATMGNYAYVWSEGDVQRYFLNSIAASTATVVLNLLVAALLGYALARVAFRGREALFAIGLSTMIVPFQSIMLPLFGITKSVGLTNNLGGIVVPTAAVTLWLSTYILREAFRAIPLELEEAAFVDGCSRLRLWFQIMLPLVKAPLATAAILVFTLTWSDFLWPLIVMQDPKNFTISVGLQYFMSILTSNWHHIAAIGIIASLPTVGLFLLLQRHFFSGVLSGASKG